MLKKYSIYFCLMGLFLILIYLVKITFSDSENQYAVLVDGQKMSSFPEKGSYDVNVSCENATVIWNYEDWTLDIENITGEVSCSISFTSKEKKYLSEYIKTLTSDEGVYNENGYRYEGKEVNNYIRFNNQDWRIVGVFDSAVHGVNANLTKLIKNETIGDYTFDSTGTKDVKFTNSTIRTLLNDYYYLAQNGTGTASCYHHSTTLAAECDFRTTGIQTGYRNMVENVNWNVDATDNTTYTADYFYTFERSSSTVTNYIGFIYPSDYGYMVTSDICSRDTNLSDYSGQCAGNTWLKTALREPTIMQKPSSSLVYDIDYSGDITTNYGSSYPFSIRPALYLKANVFIISGDGSVNNPYIIDID